MACLPETITERQIFSAVTTNMRGQPEQQVPVRPEGKTVMFADDGGHFQFCRLLPWRKIQFR